MIDLLKNLKTGNDVRIVVFLLESPEPVRLKDIYESLKINRKHCSDALKRLAENGTITKFSKLGATVFAMSHFGLIEESKMTH